MSCRIGCCLGLLAVGSPSSTFGAAMLSSAVLSLSPRELRADHTAAVTSETFSAM